MFRGEDDFMPVGAPISGKNTYPANTWVRRQAAQHTTPGSMRRRIAYAREQIRILTNSGVGGDIFQRALEAHYELIRVLSERLAKMETIAAKGSDGQRHKAKNTIRQSRQSIEKVGRLVERSKRVIDESHKLLDQVHHLPKRRRPPDT